MGDRQHPRDGGQVDSAARHLPDDAQAGADVQVTGSSAEGRNTSAPRVERSTMDGPESTGDVADILDQRNDKPLAPEERGT